MLASVQEGNSYEEYSKDLPLAAGSSDGSKKFSRIPRNRYDHLPSQLIYERNHCEDPPLPLPSSCLPPCWVIKTYYYIRDWKQWSERACGSV